MRLSELVGKEIININDGLRMGTVGDSDLIINSDSGEIHSIILPNRNNFINLWMERQKIVVPWEAVRKIGREVIVIELDEQSTRTRHQGY